MFNKTIVQESRRYPSSTYTTIHEHRAPTDQSVRLLNEMEEKALANIIDRLSTSDNTLVASVFVINEPRSMDRFVCYKMTLNGKNHKGKLRIEFDSYSRESPVRALIREFSEIIAMEILSPLLAELQR